MHYKITQKGISERMENNIESGSIGSDISGSGSIESGSADTVYDTENFENDTADYEHELEKIPRNVEVKKRFEEHYRLLLGDDYEKFMNYSLSYIRKCVRVNTLKIGVDEIKNSLSDRWELVPIPWCKEGFWIQFKDGKRFDISRIYLCTGSGINDPSCCLSASFWRVSP